MQQPARRRRRTAPTGTTSPASTGEHTARAPLRRSVPVVGVREHHVTTDYSYVKKDLALVVVVTTIATAFIVGMSFVL